jgi:hypothetical protein
VDDVRASATIEHRQRYRAARSKQINLATKRGTAFAAAFLA